MKKGSVFSSLALVIALLSNLIFQVTPAYAAASDKDITAFSLSTVPGTSPVPSYVGVINESAVPNATITVTVPAGTNLSTTNFYAVFTTTGSSVKIGSAVQTSGAAPTNKFISPKTYTVVAADLSTKNYVVTVTVAPDLTAKDITAFSFASPAATGSIVGTNITVNVPFGTNVTALVATFTHTGASIAVGATPQVSGVTANDFTSPVSYVVTAADASTKTYTVTVNVDPGTSKAITSFAIPGQIGSSVINEGAGTIGINVPFGTNVTALVPAIVHTGASVSPNSGVAQDFTAPVVYTVTALNASTKAYTVTVTVAAPSTTKAITSFTVPGQTGLTVIDEGLHTIRVVVPFGTNVTALVPAIYHTGASVSPNSGVAQDFTNPVNYTVTAQDASTQVYVVTIAPNITKDITSFSFTSPAATGSIVGTNISVTVPYGTDVTALVATFTHNGTGVTVGATPQVSGTTPNNFTSPVVYTVTGLDASTKDFTVTVTIALNPAKDITAFGFTSPAATGSIVGTNIAVPVPAGTNVTALVATFTHTGASVKVGGFTQVSGVTANNFTSPRVYTVTAADGSTKNYTVTVTVATAHPTITASGAATVTPGGQYVFTFTYTTDLGVDGTQVAFALPAHTTYVSDSGTFCSPAGGTVTCNLGSITTAGGSFTVTVAVDKLKQIGTNLSLATTSYSISGTSVSLTNGTATVTALTNSPFADVNNIYWSRDYIQAIWSAGITSGCLPSPLSYCPDATITRAEMAIFLLKGIHGGGYAPPAVGASTGFADVATDYWAAAWVKQLGVEGITSGCGGGNYCPDAVVTRAEMAVFLLKSKHGTGYVPPAAVGLFTDVPIGHWADKWIERLAVEGITAGCGGGNYCPNSSVTRAQMAVFIQKTFAATVPMPTP